MWFNIDGKPARFSINDFALAMKLVCKKLPLSLRKKARKIRIRDTYWKTNKIKSKNLFKILQKWPRGKSQVDKLKISLLYFLETKILNSDPKNIVSQKYMSTVEDLETQCVPLGDSRVFFDNRETPKQRLEGQVQSL